MVESVAAESKLVNERPQRLNVAMQTITSKKDTTTARSANVS